MKYVVILDWSGLEYPIIFPNVIQHNSMVTDNLKVVSAGECSINNSLDGSGKPKASCWGQSISLRVKSRGEEDAELINKAIENY
jgi:hypothetical protein